MFQLQPKPIAGSIYCGFFEVDTELAATYAIPGEVEVPWILTAIYEYLLYT